MAEKFENVEEFVETISDLPALPSNIQKINELLSNEKTCAEDISKVISSDQALTTKILKTANSAYYGRLSKVVKVQDAVVLIGMTNIKSMLYSIFVNQMYSKGKHTEPLMLDLWKHSIATALTARKIIETVNPSFKDATYTAGLLHDIGELILFSYANKMYAEILEEIRIDTVMPRGGIEESIAGFSHSDLGAVLARKWNLPRTIKNAIFFHHNPADCDTEDDGQTVAAVYIADILCMFSAAGGTDTQPKGKTLMEVIFPGSIQKLGLTEEKLSWYLADMEKVRGEAEVLMESLKGK